MPRAEYYRRYRSARREASLDGHIRLLEIGPAILRYAENNGQETYSESEGMEYIETETTTTRDTETESGEPSASENESDNLKLEIVKWVHHGNVPLNHLKPLIKILRKTNDFHDLQDARTILQLPRRVESISKCGGQYIYIGVESGISRLIKMFPKSFNNCDITFDLNIDGLPIFSSSNGQFWPTLCHVMKFQPFVVALFYGHAKPNNVDEFLNDLLQELKELENKEIIINDKTFKFNLRVFICDAPARQMIKCIRSHRSYYSCERCKIPGRLSGKSVFYPLPARLPDLRTDAQFNRCAYVRHQKAMSPLVTHGLNISCIKDIVLDVMHLVYLGVVKKLLQLYCNSSILTRAQKAGIERNFAKIKRLPQEFARQQRTMKYVDRFKATEYRTFLLYTGPVILRGVLSAQQYKHFLFLSIAMSVLCDEDDEYRNAQLEFAHDNLMCFVKYADVIFGEKFMTYNTHGLIHLVDDVRNFNCPIDDISAFPFENHLGKLKRSVRQGKNPIAQLVKRIKGLEITCLDQSLFKKEMKIGQQGNGEKENADSFFLLRNHLAIVVKKKSERYKCHLFEKDDLTNFFTSPCDSKELDIYHLRDRRPPYSVRYVHASELKTKMVPVPYIDGIALFKLRHTGYI